MQIILTVRRIQLAGSRGGKLREGEIGGETPASTFDREFRSYVASKACIADRGTEYWFAGGISAAGSASWIASCPAAFAFPRTLRGISVRSLLSNDEGERRHDRDVKPFSSTWHK